MTIRAAGPCPPRPRSGRRRGALIAAVAAAAAAIAMHAARTQAPGDAAPSPAPPDAPPQAAGGADTAAAHETWQARFQTTWVQQHKPAFAAAYTGPNSLVPERERSYSLTATAFLGVRPWPGGELCLNPEMALGLPLSRPTGLGGFPNGELARTAGREPTYYLARAFVRQTWNLGGATLGVASDLNQIAGTVHSRRVVATVGMLSLIDVFDDNAYSHDARTQFMDWSIVTHAAYDFAGDARGCSRGAAIEWHHDDWTLRVARFALLTEPNGTELNMALGRSHGDQVEVERGWRLDGDRPGRACLLVFRNRAVTGSFAEALVLAAAGGGTPDLARVRRDRIKSGYGVNVEQSLGALGGVFLRASRNDGRTEVYAHTEVDRSISAGVLLDGARWGRRGDTVGIAGARNGLSASHRRYLAAGGLGFFLGDGTLDDRPEAVAEAYYSLALAPRAWLSLNAQRIVHPAYNAARGPVNVVGLRLQASL